MKLLSVADAARLLGVTDRHIYTLVDSGTLRCQRIGGGTQRRGTPVFRESDVLELRAGRDWLAARRKTKSTPKGDDCNE